MTENVKKFTYEEAYQNSLDYFNGDELAAKVFVDKYVLRNNEGDILEDTPEKMHWRLAKEFARIEEKYPNPMSKDEIFELLDRFKYVVPQGSPMSSIGNIYQTQSAGNCFVIEPPPDSYGGIMKADQELVQLAKRRAGIGIDISNLRPRGTLTKNAAKTTDGISVFMERFSNSCREVAQSGRRGALLLSLSVHHPEIRTFINIKKDLKKVTGANISIRLSDEFMNAVEKGGKFQLRWPVDSKSPIIEELIDAKELWEEINFSAWNSAEPGLLFWDNIIKNSTADIYAEKDPAYKTTSTNPCLTGDTKVAVADGRGFIEIETLAKEGKDIPVYTLNENGSLVVKTMRNPRITGYKQDIYKITLEDNSTFKATKNHKIILNDGSIKEVKDLKTGDSIFGLWKIEASIKDVFPATNAKSQNYFWFRKSDNKRLKSEHRLIYEYYNGPIPKKYVIHHLDFDAQNNAINNLKCMSREDHNKLHGDHMRGANNPIFKLKLNKEKYQQYIQKQSEVNSGINNSNFSGFSNQEIKNHAVNLTKEIGQRFSTEQWDKYAKKSGIPQAFSNWRKLELGSITDLAKWAAIECGYDYVNYDPRVVRTLKDMLEQGYEAFISDNGSIRRINKAQVYVYKYCEECKIKFNISFERREIAFCSKTCSNFNANKKGSNTQRQASLKKIYQEKKKITKKQQLEIFTSLKFVLNRDPLQKEWEIACKEKNVQFRIGKVSPFKKWSDLKKEAKFYNHKIVSVEYIGKEDVYNGTVDDTHQFFIGGWETQQENGKKQWFSILNKQCGEIPMGKDSCRLLLVNLKSFVQNPYTTKAKFDYSLYSSIVEKSQRLMDDLVDLELELIDRIITKINSDPESENVKKIELDLWKEFRRTCETGRRTGLGITAAGDAIAALGIRYGSEKSIEVIEEIYKTLALAAHKSSCILAKERGVFPLYDYSLEKKADCPYLKRIWAAAPEIEEWSKKYGRRNIALTTTAPAGSVSILTKTTSGIEPVFLLEYTRRKKINPNDKNPKVDFVDLLGDKWQEYTVFHYGFKEWSEISGKKEIEESPYYKSTSNDIDWVNKIKIQAAAQKWVSHAISNTTNVPNNTSVDIIKKIYMTGWKSGCKGVTIYRNGCRSGVLINNDDNKNTKNLSDGRSIKFLSCHAPKRPEKLPCNIHQVSIKNEAWTILIGLMENRPYEVFGGLSSLIEIPKKYKSGILLKHPRKTTASIYDLIIGESEDDQFKIKDIVQVFNNPTHGSLTRILSLSLRHGTPVKFVVEQLLKEGESDMFSFSRVVSRVLKGYIIDGEKASGSCPSCGSNDLIFQEGCISCKCGFSKCS